MPIHPLPPTYMEAMNLETLWNIICEFHFANCTAHCKILCSVTLPCRVPSLKEQKRRINPRNVYNSIWQNSHRILISELISLLKTIYSIKMHFGQHKKTENILNCWDVTLFNCRWGYSVMCTLKLQVRIQYDLHYWTTGYDPKWHTLFNYRLGSNITYPCIYDWKIPF